MWAFDNNLFQWNTFVIGYPKYRTIVTLYSIQMFYFYFFLFFFIRIHYFQIFVVVWRVFLWKQCFFIHKSLFARQFIRLLNSWKWKNENRTSSYLEFSHTFETSLVKRERERENPLKILSTSWKCASNVLWAIHKVYTEWTSNNYAMIKKEEK